MPPRNDTIDLEQAITSFPRVEQGSINIDNASSLSVHRDPGDRILIAQRQWDIWNREFAQVTFTTNTEGTGGVWRFENLVTIDPSTVMSSSETNTIWFNPAAFATNCIEIRGDLRVVPDNSVEWNPGVVLPYSAYSIPANRFQPGIQPIHLSAEERRRRNEANTAWLRAEQLLRQYLSREQRRELTRDGQFHIFVGDRCYRIRRGRVGNVEWVDRNGQVLQRYCCHVKDMVPTGDNLLAQMMLLTHNEPEFIRLANIHYRQDGIQHPLEAATSGTDGRFMLSGSHLAA